MAALTWREVSAPQIDIRNFMGAGQSITGAFDKLGQMFVDRENRLRGEATDEAIARVLASRDRDAVIDPSTLGKRVNAREVLAAQVKHRGDLLAQGIQNETLMDSEAAAKYGYLRDILGARALAGQDVNGGIPQGLEADALFNRARSKWDFNDLRDRFTDNAENAKHNRAQEAAAMLGAQASMISARANAAESAARVRRWNQEDADATEAKALRRDASGFIDRYTADPRVSLMAPEEQLLRLKQTSAWNRFTPEKRALISENLIARAAERQALPDYMKLPGADNPLGRMLAELSPAKTALDDLDQRIERDAYRANESAEIIKLGRDKKYAGATPASVAAAYDKLGYTPFINDRYLGKGYLDRLMNGPQGLPAPLVQAALERAIHRPWMGSDRAVRQTLDNLVEAYYNQNETRKTEQQIASGKAPGEALRRDMARIEQQVAAFTAQFPGKPLPDVLKKAQAEVLARQLAIEARYNNPTPPPQN